MVIEMMSAHFSRVESHDGRVDLIKVGVRVAELLAAESAEFQLLPRLGRCELWGADLHVDRNLPPTKVQLIMRNLSYDRSPTPT